MGMQYDILTIKDRETIENTCIGDIGCCLSTLAGIPSIVYVDDNCNSVTVFSEKNRELIFRISCIYMLKKNKWEKTGDYFIMFENNLIKPKHIKTLQEYKYL